MLDSFFPYKKEKPVNGLTGLGGGSILSTSASAGGGDSITNGIAYESGGCTYYIFTGPGSFTLGSDKTCAAAIIVGGGGGGSGGIYHGAGAGAGGVAYTTTVNIPVGTYQVAIGPGGCGQANSAGSMGTDTYVCGPLGIAWAYGGGASGGYVTQGCPGGSGGGTGRASPNPVGGNATQTPQPAWNMTGYGCPGTCQAPPGGYGSGGGGGAGGTAPSPYNPSVGGAGGCGRAFNAFPGCTLGPSIDPIYPGWSVAVTAAGCFAGGGGGSSFMGSGGTAAPGGGGGSARAPGCPGVNGTGGGGGAYNPSHYPGCGGNGGHGIAIFRWTT